MAAKQAGKIRFIGFTGHKDPIVHLRMLEVAKQHGFHFDTLQMPVNVMDAHFRSFGKNVIPVANEQGVAVLAMKTLAGRAILASHTATAVECLRYAMSQPVSVVISGMDSMAILEQGLKVASNFKPMSSTETEALLARTKTAAMTGQYEAFKTTSRVDGTARNPDWLG